MKTLFVAAALTVVACESASHPPATPPGLVLAATPTVSATTAAVSEPSATSTPIPAPPVTTAQMTTDDNSSSLQHELDQLEKAVDVRRSDPARALALCNESAIMFPKGFLAQERETVAIEALESLGRWHEARVRAKKFVAEYPSAIDYGSRMAHLAECP